MKYHRMLLASASALTLLGAASVAKAQQTPAGQPGSEEGPVATLEEVLVTARKREEALADVPGAIAVIGAETLENRGGATSAGELFAGEPSVRFFDTNSPLNSEVSLRGSSTARGTNADPSIGLYRNGAYIGGGRVGGRSFTRLDLFDVGRVEVLRGTQGALYGRNAVGGAINIISQRPQFQAGGFIDYRYGLEPEGHQVQGVVNIPLNDMFAVRLGGEYVDRDDGFFYNPGNDVYFDRESGYSLRGQLRMRANRLDATLLVEHQDMELPAVSYQIFIQPTPPRFPVGYSQEPYSYPWSTKPFSEQKLNNAILSVDYDLGSARLTSTTSVRERDSGLAVDFDGLDAPTLVDLRARGIVVGNVDTNSSSTTFDLTTNWSQDIRLAGSALENRLDWLVGAEYLSQESDSESISGRTPTVLNGQSPGNRAPVATEYESVAAYGSIGYDFTELLNLSAELRYTSDDRSVVAGLFDLRTSLAVGGSAFNFTANDASDNISYNLTGAYRLPNSILAYLKVGTSYRAGGFNTNLGDPRQPIPIPPAYGDETSTTYEFGLKGDLTPRLYAAFSGYRSYSQNLIVQNDNGCNTTNPTCPTISTSFLSNAGDGEIWGLEVEAIYRTEIGGNQLRATFGASRQGGEVVAGIYNGNTLPQIPDWIASAELFIRRPFVAGTELFGNIRYNGQWGGMQELRQPSPAIDDRQLINLRAGIRIPNSLGSLDISAFVNNATDETYIVFGDRSTTRRLSQPRTFGLQLRQRW